jgi:hypothetical protein
MMTDNPGGSPPATAPAETSPLSNREEITFKFVGGPTNQSAVYQAPDLPPHFVSRAELLAIKRLLLARPTSSLAPLTLHGPSGSGKTALATALAHDAEVLENFPDGVLWVSLGEGVDVQHAQASWGDALGNDLSHLPDTASAPLLRTCCATAASARHRRRGRCQQIKTLNVSEQNCARLITTDITEDLSLHFKS